MSGLARRLTRAVTGCLVVASIACSPSDRMPEHPDVVIVVIDSLRRDHLGSFGYARPTSPGMDGLFERGVLFTNVVAVASHTVPVVASLLTGRYPTETGVRYYAQNRSFDGHSKVTQRGPKVGERLDLLAEAFSRAGYRTAAVVSNPWLTVEAGFAQGFADFVTIECSGLLASGSPPCDGIDVLNAAAPFLEAPSSRDENAPLFLYLHLMDVHYPYEKKGITRNRFVTTPGRDRYRNGPIRDLDAIDRDYMIALYDEGIAKLDDVMGRLATALDARGRKDETLLVVTSDHGEEFTEHGGLGHGRSLYREVVDTFLYFRMGDRLTARRIDARVSLVDVAPTLLEIAGIESPPETSGHSLLTRLQGDDPPPGTEAARPLFMDLGQVTGVVRGPWKLIRRSHHSELYDVSSDAGEEENVATRQPDVLGALSALLDEQLAAAVSEDSDAAEIDAATRERLRAVGYVE